jgi:hypothetical protein
LPVIGVGVPDAECLRLVGAALLVLVGNGDDLGAIALEPDGAERVT